MGLPPQLRDSLYIRRSYRRLFNLLWTSCSNAAHPLGFVVTGTPGIGKSAFALYLIQQLGSKQQIVFYEYQEWRSWRRIKFDFSGPKVVAKSMMASLHDDDLHADAAWLIVEGPPAAKLEFGGLTKTVVLSSPDHSNFRSFTKGRYCREPLYMPTWSLAELQACRQRLYRDVAADTVAERYSWLGGTISW